jgi:multiple sugar transport system permease protein
MIIAYSALTAMPQEVIEASKIDGANRIQTFRFVVFQLIKPALLVGLTFRIIFALREFGIIWILTEGGPAGGTEILPIYLYRQTFRYYEFGRGAATTTIMLIVTILISIPLVRRIYKGMYEKIY